MFQFRLSQSRSTNFTQSATKLLFEGGMVTGVEYVKGGQTLNEYGPVVIATGGFGADFSSDSLLAKYRPDLMHLPTSNGEHCTGGGMMVCCVSLHSYSSTHMIRVLKRASDRDE